MKKTLTYLLFSLIAVFSASAQCTSGCDRTDPADVNLTVAVNEVVCITGSKVFGTVQVRRGYTPFGEVAGELRVCGASTVLEAQSSFNIEPDWAGWYNGGVVKLFNCAVLEVTGSFSDNNDVGIQAYCSDCGNSNYTIDTAVQVTGSKVLTGWNCTQVLPVELTVFDLYKSGESVTALWKTSSEVNNDYFEVQTSTDGINWTTAGVIQGAGNSNVENTYTFTDNSPKGNVVYYRLKQVDFDGSFEYSDVKLVRFKTADYLLAYQTGNTLYVELEAKAKTQVQLIDMNGKIINGAQFFNASDNGKSLVKFDATGLASGVYSVNVYNNGAIATTKVVVAK